MKYWLFDGADVIGPLAPHEIAARADFTENTLVCPESESENDSAWKEASIFEDFTPQGLQRSKEESSKLEELAKQNSSTSKAHITTLPNEEKQEEPNLPSLQTLEEETQRNLLKERGVDTSENISTPNEQKQEDEQTTSKISPQAETQQTQETPKLLETPSEKPAQEPVQQEQLTNSQTSVPSEELAVAQQAAEQAQGETSTQQASQAETQKTETKDSFSFPVSSSAKTRSQKERANITAQQAAQETKIPFAPQLTLWVMGISAALLLLAACMVWVFYMMYYPKLQGQIRPAQAPAQTTAPKDTQPNVAQDFSIPVPPPVALSQTERAIKIAQHHQLPAGKGSVENYLNRVYRSQLEQGYTANWSAEPLHNHSYIVKYRLAKTRTEPIVYVFQVDIEKEQLTGALNNITLDLVGKN